jgi:DNA repair protein RadD
LRVDYYDGIGSAGSEWVCFDHSGFARDKADRWWRRRSKAPLPASCDEALYYAEAGALAVPSKITKVRDGKYWRITGCQLGPVPAWREPGEEDMVEPLAGRHAEAFGSIDEVPF